ncbi:MAGUK p55 subfamily member 4 [Ornithorhynchus anatinus]|uniref:MAGUK p55 subfamily member 4 n=1 Tax=Ornithorhynchus anatinus TaxID=9258 RepID=UPI0019D4DCE7|nr:MAGUK p55 subfamily member 4 [Ornithorhynchus anatinus]
MIHQGQGSGTGSPGTHDTLEPPAEPSQENGSAQVLRRLVRELRLMSGRDAEGTRALCHLLEAPWMRALVQVHDRLRKYSQTRPAPAEPQAQALSGEVAELLRTGKQTDDTRELSSLLRTPHVGALLTAHDSVALEDFEPVLPPLPDNLPEDEDAMRIVCLVKNKQPLGATIKRHEVTGDVVIARVILGGLADRSGLLHAGDKLVEVNGVSVAGLDPEQIIHILALSRGIVTFKVVPVSDRPVNDQTALYVRAMTDYRPQQDPAIPCADAGLPFRRGDVLQIVDQNDVLWWQARKASDRGTRAGLIPSSYLLTRKQQDFCPSRSFQPLPYLKSTLLSTVEEEDDMKIDEKWVEADEELFESEELREEDEEFAGVDRRTFIAGFRRSTRLCRRRSARGPQPGCPTCCPGRGCRGGGGPYEEVARYQRSPADRPRAIVLVGPSGVGVNELRRRLIGFNPDRFQSAVPHTTRARKSYEEDGREYHFVSRETFEGMVNSHRMLEFGTYGGNFYGTSADAVRSVLEGGRICVLDLEPQGIQGARTHDLKPYVIFIKPPGGSRLRRSRREATIITDYFVNVKFKDEDLQEMEDAARRTEARFGQFFDEVIVNDDLPRAFGQLLSAVQRAQGEPQWVPAAWLSVR